MSFQIKDFNSIVLAQINHARAVSTRVTDFQPGSVVRTIMEAPAVELEELYLQMFLGLRDAIPVATFQSFGFAKLPARSATGWVSISANEALADSIHIPLGTIFSTADGREYASTQVVDWAAGSTVVRIPVAAVVPGLSGNVAAGEIVNAAVLGAGLTTGNAAMTTGADAESDREREARFAEFIRSLSRGTVAACTFAARSVTIPDINGNIAEYVTRLGLDESPGILRIYLRSNIGAPSAELLAASQLILDGSRNVDTGVIVPGFRPAGVRVDVLPMAERAVPMSIEVGMVPGKTRTTAVDQALNDIYASAVRAILPGSTLYVGLLVEQLLAVPGVLSVLPTSGTNIACGASEALVPGTLTITSL